MALVPGAFPDNPGVLRRDFNPPPHVVDFGYYPDVDALLPGDLILTAALKPDWSSKLISFFQRKNHPQTCRFTHAAMYMGRHGQIIEATFDSFFSRVHGVRVGQLSDYIPTHELLVRRLPDAFVESAGRDPMTARWQLVISAMTHMRRPYGFRQLTRFIGYPRWALKAYRKPKDFVCSTLYDAALADALNRVIDGGNSVTPAKLASAVEFVTVDVQWVTVAPLEL